MSMLKNMLKGGTICGLLAAGAMFAAAPTAKAALVVNLNGGTTITDNGAGDTDPATGQITNSSTVAGFGVAITVAESNSPGTSSSGLIQISSLSIKNQGAGQGSLTISVSDNNYTAPGTNGSPMLLESDIGGTFAKGSAAGDSVSFRSFVDPANVQPATVNGTAALSFSNPSSTATNAFSGSNSVNWTHGVGAYSLTGVATISLTSGGQVNLSGSTTASLVPEPASLSLLALGGLLAARRRRN